jgi:uncharacterized protein (TIGR03083 family)
MYESLHPVEPVEAAHLFPEIRSALVELLNGLGAREWETPTVCPGWTVHDLAAHLLGVDVGNLSRRRDAFSDPSSISASSEHEHLVGFLTRFNEAWVLAARRMSPRLLCRLLAVVGIELDKYFGSLDGQVMGEPVSWAGPESAPVWLDVAREYTERWVHQQQMRDAVGQPGLTEPRYVTPVLATFVHALPHALRESEAQLGTLVRIVIRGDAGGSWTMIRSQDRWFLCRDSSADAAAQISLDAETAWRLWTKGISVEAAKSRVVLEGNQIWGEMVLNAVAIIA